MAQRNILEVAPLQSYNQTLNYYNRVTNDSGTLIVPYDVDRIYHALNLLSLQNRSYKLYHASAGLQKTDDQIDKLYDLGKDDVDQTFSGSDRPEHIQAWSNSEGVGNWQISLEKESTNYCKESNDLGSIVGGNWAKTENKGDSPFEDANEAVEVAMNTNSTGASNYIELAANTANTFSSGNYITISFYAKKVAGSSGKPRLHVEDSNGNTLFNEEFETNVGEYQFFEYTAQFSADGEISSTIQRIEDNNTSADTVYQFWGFQIEDSPFSTNTIQTNGSTATRLAPIPTITNFHYTGKGTGQGGFYFWYEFLFGEQFSDRRHYVLFSDFHPSGGILRIKQPFSNYIYNVDFFNIRADSLTSRYHINFKKSNENIQPFERYKMFILCQWYNGVFELYWGIDNGNLYRDIREPYDVNVDIPTQLQLRGGEGRFSTSKGTSDRYYMLHSLQEFQTQNAVKGLFDKTGKTIFGNSFQINNYKDQT